MNDLGTMTMFSDFVITRKSRVIGGLAIIFLCLCFMPSAKAQTPTKRYMLINNVIIPFDGFVAPPRPQNFNVVIALPYGATINWSETVDTDSYRLEQQNYITKEWSTIYQGANNTFSVQALQLGRYYFRVYACGGNWCGDSSHYRYLDIGPQFDADQDGVLDYADQCPETPTFQVGDIQGCSISQRDTDGDGVSDAIDLCPATAPGVTVSAAGCEPTTEDSDGDGVTNDLDRCDATPAGSTPNSDGCAGSQLDSDSDGVTDDLDPYPLQSATQCLP